jgi:exodeoxyribonuclease-3
MSATRRRKAVPATPSLFGTDERAFTVCSLNCNGLRSAASKGWAQWLSKGRPDVLCLQEVRAWPEQVDVSLRCPEGYNSRWLNAEKKGYSGVATYSRPAADRYVEGSGLDWSDAEGRVLRTDLPEMTVLNVYVPSGSSSEERQQRKYLWLDHFLVMTAELLSQGRPTIICGDFNIAHTELDIHAPKRNEKNSGFLPEERTWFSSLLNQGWVDVLRGLHPDEPELYSWWSNRGRAREKDLGWRLDYVLASPDLAPCAREAWIEKKAGLSDHAPVWVRFAL